MKSKKIKIALSFSVGYFLIVMLVLLGYEASLGKSDNSGLPAGLVLALITMPGLFYEGYITELFNCERYSICEHVIGAIFAGGINAIIIFIIFYVIGSLFSINKNN